jgi:S1-C subfamily serine protease
MFRTVSTLLASAALAAAFASATPAGASSLRDTPVKACAAKAMPSAVTIQVKTVKKGDDGKPEQGTSLGSGTVIDGRGFIITNQHVIEGARAIRLRLSGDGADDWRDAQVVFADEVTDLAVLSVKVDKEKPLPEYELGTASDLAVGEPIYVIGSPFGQEFSLSAGVVSRVKVPMLGQMPPSKWLIQTDAAVNHGNSGGSMYNADCELVGIVELKMGDAGLGFAITADRAARVVASHMSAEWANVYHGIRSLQIDPGTGADRQIAIVKEMAVDSPAAAVLKLNDRIITVNDRPVHNMFDLERSVWDNNAGDEVKVHVIRDGQPVDVVIKLGAVPANSELKD